MKNLLYFITIIFNALGGICSFSLFFFGVSFCMNYLPLIILSLLVFVSSFTITIAAYQKNKKPCYIKTHYHQPQTAINDYSKYFKSRKYDFIVY